jgi:DNA-binding IclR family transcriptional regulator
MKARAVVRPEAPRQRTGAEDGGRILSGAQTVDRACGLLNDIARHGPGGARLIDLTASSKLTRPTAHRLLQSLAAAGFVDQDHASKRYRLGVAVHGLALSAPSPLHQLAELRPLLEGVARRTGETAYLMMRQGDEVFCIARAVGESPIRTLLIEVGAYRPVAATIAGICMLAPLQDEEIAAILRRTAGAMARRRNATAEYAWGQIHNVRRNGYCISREVLIEGTTGISAAVPDVNGRPFLAISLSAVSPRVPEARVKPLAADLTRTCARMGQLVTLSARELHNG